MGHCKNVIIGPFSAIFGNLGQRLKSTGIFVNVWKSSGALYNFTNNINLSMSRRRWITEKGHHPVTLRLFG